MRELAETSMADEEKKPRRGRPKKEDVVAEKPIKKEAAMLPFTTTDELPEPKFDEKTGKLLSKPEPRYMVQGFDVIAIYRGRGGIHRRAVGKLKKGKAGNERRKALKKLGIPGA